MVQSIKKGKKFELEVAHLLSKITGGARWNRVPNSGGIATTGATTDPRFAGDVYTDEKRYADIVVECKIQRKPINLLDLINPKSMWNQWIGQTKVESKGKFWLLFFRWNAGEILLCLPTKDEKAIEKLFDVPFTVILETGDVSVLTFG